MFLKVFEPLLWHFHIIVTSVCFKGTSVMTVIAQDDDDQGGLSYSTEQSESSNDGFSYFQINNEGLVTVRTSAPVIDREATSVFYLAVTASDGASSSKFIILLLIIPHGGMGACNQ